MWKILALVAACCLFIQPDQALAQQAANQVRYCAASVDKNTVVIGTFSADKKGFQEPQTCGPAVRLIYDSMQRQLLSAVHQPRSRHCIRRNYAGEWGDTDWDIFSKRPDTRIARRNDSGLVLSRTTCNDSFGQLYRDATTIVGVRHSATPSRSVPIQDAYSRYCAVRAVDTGGTRTGEVVLMLRHAGTEAEPGLMCGTNIQHIYDMVERDFSLHPKEGARSGILYCAVKILGMGWVNISIDQKHMNPRLPLPKHVSYRCSHVMRDAYEQLKQLTE